MHWLSDNPWLIEWAAYVLSLLIGSAVVVVAAPSIERFFTPSVSD